MFDFVLQRKVYVGKYVLAMVHKEKAILSKFGFHTIQTSKLYFDHRDRKQGAIEGGGRPSRFLVTESLKSRLE